MASRTSYLCAICSLLALLGMLSTHCVSAHADVVYIEVQSAKLRKEPKAWAAPTADLKYGDTVTILESSNSWHKVRAGSGAEGYIHNTAVTSREVILKSSATPTGTIGKFEAVLAGKGFNQELVDSFAQKHAEIDMRKVDAMRARSQINEADLYVFMKQGGLHVTELP